MPRVLVSGLKPEQLHNIRNIFRGKVDIIEFDCNRNKATVPTGIDRAFLSQFVPHKVTVQLQQSNIKASLVNGRGVTCMKRRIEEWLSVYAEATAQAVR